MEIGYPHLHVDVNKYPAIPVVVWQGMAIGYYFKSPYPGYPYPIRQGDIPVSRLMIVGSPIVDDHDAVSHRPRERITGERMA